MFFCFGIATSLNLGLVGVFLQTSCIIINSDVGIDTRAPTNCDCIMFTSGFAGKSTPIMFDVMMAARKQENTKDGYKEP